MLVLSIFECFKNERIEPLRLHLRLRVDLATMSRAGLAALPTGKRKGIPIINYFYSTLRIVRRFFRRIFRPGNLLIRQAVCAGKIFCHDTKTAVQLEIMLVIYCKRSVKLESCCAAGDATK